MIRALESNEEANKEEYNADWYKKKEMGDLHIYIT